MCPEFSTGRERDRIFPAVVDSPLAEADPHATPLYIVGIKGPSRWRVFELDNGDQAVSSTLEEAEANLFTAKKHIKKFSNGEKLAADGLRIFASFADEL